MPEPFLPSDREDLMLAVAREGSRDSTGAADGSGAAIGHDGARERQGDLSGAAVACEGASARGESDARALFKLGYARERLGDLPGAAVAYEAASARGESDARPLLRLGHVRMRLGDLSGAVVAYEGANSRSPTDGQILTGLGKAARSLVRRHETPAALQLLTRVFERSGGEVALDRFLTDHYGDRRCQLEVDSTPILTGLSNIHLGMHTIRSLGGDVLDCVVQKVIGSEREIAVLQLIREVQDRLPSRITTPKVLGLYEAGGIAHVFFEFVEFRQNSPRLPDYSIPQLERMAEIYAAIPEVLPLHRIPDRLRCPVCSVADLRRTVALIEHSAAFAAARARDAAIERDLRVFAAQVEPLAEATRVLPHVFSHNDATTLNMMPILDGRGQIESVRLLDWGLASPNLVGAELHVFLEKHLPNVKINALFDRYFDAMKPRVRGLERWHVEVGAHLYRFTRSSHRRFANPRRWRRVQHAIRSGRFAADRLAAIS